MTDGIAPITDDDRKGRIEKARRLMVDNRLDAIVLEGGSSMFYFTGVRWGLSERPFVAVIPARGEPAWICPGFEEARARELVKSPNADVRTWQEDDSPYRLIAQALKDRGLASRRVGVEERLRFFIVDGMRAASPAVQFVLGTPVTAGCRMIKSPAEIALMQRANDITLQAIGASFKTLKEGMTQQELSSNVGEATRKLGGVGDGGLVIFGKYTAFPHGSIQPQRLRAGDVVLIDGGGRVHGYSSDITRTAVFGAAPSDRQRKVWDVVRKAQQAAFAAARPGVECQAIDAAARKVIEDSGFGPGYKYLTHRLGHGIGLDGHEWPYMVKGNATKLVAGMTFTDEPGIYIPGELGIRHEDTVVVTADGCESLSLKWTGSPEDPAAI